MVVNSADNAVAMMLKPIATTVTIRPAIRPYSSAVTQRRSSLRATQKVSFLNIVTVPNDNLMKTGNPMSCNFKTTYFLHANGYSLVSSRRQAGVPRESNSIPAATHLGPGFDQAGVELQGGEPPVETLLPC